jgi:hypothetical protein
MAENEPALQVIRGGYTDLLAGRQEYDFLPPALVSHAQDYADQPERLRRYSRQVVSGRIMILLCSTRMTTQALLQTYLLGVDNKLPFPLLLSARSQLELYSVVADTIRILKDNAGEHEERFVERVQAVDNALISATFGTRSSLLKQLMGNTQLSRLRATTAEDLETLSSKNVLTRLEKLARLGIYPNCKEDYERLCEFVHPNWGMNMLHVVPSPIDARLLRFSLRSADPFNRALTASVGAMQRAASGALGAVDTLEPPFGMGEVTYFR